MSSDVQKIIKLAEKICPSLLTAGKQSLLTQQPQHILLPPVAECLDCGGHLTNNHLSKCIHYLVQQLLENSPFVVENATCTIIMPCMGISLVQIL